MKSYHALIVQFLLLFPSLYMGLRSYEIKRNELLCDMNQALTKTLERQSSIEISPDTIQNYLSFLQEPALREQSYVYYALDRSDSLLCSDRVAWSDGQTECEFRSYASLSVSSILSLSDQRWSLSLLLPALGWAVFSVRYFHRRMEDVVARMGTLVLSSDNRFYTTQGAVVHLTPMQEQLLRMFFTAKDHSLSKQEICDALWPKKPDASETLYTLIKRLKPVIEQQGGLHIDSERGRDYVLK